ncbi:MAG: hypothetical protein NTW86_26355 [Candidatus Sumerlaeota bacterium]|nr:hypothetical protein [Candidatus Sumerlaeota bacterium]
MKRWWLVTCLAYVGLLGLLAAPLLLLCFSDVPPGDGMYQPPRVSPSEALGIYREPLFWILVAVGAVCQGLFLLIPVRAAEARPVRRRHVLSAAIVCAFLFTLLILLFALSLTMAWFRDNIPEPLAWGELCATGLLWVFWGIVFYRLYDPDDPLALTHRLGRWLYRGSIAELLVAVPSHVITRQRNDCCAPAVTFCGIATGLSVMLLTFGPGVFFLFAERRRRLQPRKTQETKTLLPGQPV